MKKEIVNQLIKETLDILNASIKKVEEHLDQLNAEGPTNRGLICYWPSVFLTVDMDYNSNLFISKTDQPTIFRTDWAHRICNTYRNGLNEYPVTINEMDFYKQYLIWLNQQVVNTKALNN